MPLMIDTARLAAVFSRYPDILAVYLFGSHAAGRARPDSDLDLAVLPRDRTGGLRSRKLELLTDLVEAGYCDVDLVFLDSNDVVLNYEAVRRNRVVYRTPGFDRGETYVRFVGQYLDFLPYLDVQRAAYKRRILGDDQRRDPQAAQ